MLCVVVMFVDRFLQTAEMLKPSTPSASHDSTGSAGSDDGAEYYPHIGVCFYKDNTSPVQSNLFLSLSKFQSFVLTLLPSFCPE